MARRKPGAVLGKELRQRVRRTCGFSAGTDRFETPQRDGNVDHETIWSVSPAALLRTLELVARDPSLVAIVWLTIPSQRRTKTSHALRKVRKRSDGLWVARPAVAPPTYLVADGLLRLYLATLRNRTAGQWHAIDTRRQFPTAAQAAEHLGCSRQNISNTLARANTKVTDATAATFTALLALAAEAAASNSQRG